MSCGTDHAPATPESIVAAAAVPFPWYRADSTSCPRVSQEAFPFARARYARESWVLCGIVPLQLRLFFATMHEDRRANVRNLPENAAAHWARSHARPRRAARRPRLCESVVVATLQSSSSIKPMGSIPRIGPARRLQRLGAFV